MTADQKQQQLAESPFSLSFRMVDGYGNDVQITMREGVSAAIVKQVFEARREFVDLATGHGWQPATVSKPASNPTNGHSAPKADPVAAGAPTGAWVPPPPTGPVAQNVAGGGFASAAEVAIDCDTLSGSVTDGKEYWKIKGGKWSKHGVTVWPEVLQAAGIGTEPGGGPYSLKGWRAHVLLKPDGNPQKVARLERIA